MLNVFINISRISPLIAFLFNFYIAVWVYMKNRGSLKNILFFLFSLDLSIWAFCCFVQSVFMDYNVAFVTDQVLFSVAAVAPPLLLHLTCAFTGRKRDIELICGYAVSLLFLAINWTPLFRSGVNLNFGARYVTTPQIGWYLYVLFYAVLVTVSLFDLYTASRSSKGSNRFRLLYVFAAIVVLIFGGNSYFILIIRKFNPVLDSFFNLASSMLLITYSLIMSYLIVKLDIMDFRGTINRFLAYAVTSLLSLLFYLLLPISFFSLFPLNSNTLIVFISLSSLLWLAICLYFEQVRMLIQTPLDRKFIQRWHDFAGIVAQLSGDLSKIYNIDELYSVIAKYIRDAVEASNIEVFSLNSTGHAVLYQDNITGKVLNDKVAEWISSRPSELVFIDDLPDGMPGEGIGFLKIIFCLASSHRIESIIGIGRKSSEEPFSDNDLKFLHALISQSMIVLDRIKPYEQIKREFDSTQRRLFETEKMLSRSARLASLGTLIAGVTHEIRNPLGVIRMGINLLAKEARDLKYLQEWRDLHITHVDRISAIIDKMLHLSKSKEAAIKELKINDLIEQYIIGFVSSKNVTVISRLSPVPNVMAVEDDLHQVLLNLTDNAFKAMPDGGQLTLKTYEMDENSAAKAVIEVSDTGIGISPENMERIFDPFFSTRHEGTGLGLSISHKIIVDLKGRIEVQSEVGKGSTFRIILPAVS